MPRKTRERCDHCKKFVDESHSMGHLEDIVSPGVEFNFAICQKCFNKHGFTPEYWDKWASENA